MTPDEIIDSYVYDVVRLLPRRQRNDVARELQALLRDELADGGAPDSDAAQAALALVRRFGPPAEVAARYRTPLTIIDPVDAHRFARAAWVGIAVIVLGGLVVTVAQPEFGSDPLRSLQGYWSSALQVSLSWLGFLVVCAAAAASARRRRPAAKAWTPGGHHRVHGQSVSRFGYAAAIAGMVLGIAVLIDPQQFLRSVTGGAIAQPALDVFAYDPAFVSQRLPVIVGLLALNALVYAVVAVEGSWRRLTRRVEVGLSLAIIGAMAWLVLAGNVYQAVETDRSIKLALVILIAVCLPFAVMRIRRERLSPGSA
jgi:hypothetical protein